MLLCWFKGCRESSLRCASGCMGCSALHGTARPCLASRRGASACSWGLPLVVLSVPSAAQSQRAEGPAPSGFLRKVPSFGGLRFSVFGSLWGPVRQVEPDGRDVCGCLCHLLPTWASTLGQHVARVVAGAVPEPAWC